MIESTTYKDSVAKGELVPQITLNKLANGEEWSLSEMSELLSRMGNQFLGDASHNGVSMMRHDLQHQNNLYNNFCILQYDNNNPALWRFGSKENPIFLAVTDYPGPQRFDIDTLDTLEYLRPKNPMTTGTGCAHFMREPGTDNSITMMMKMGAFGNHIEVQRFTPDNPGKQ